MKTFTKKISIPQQSVSAAADAFNGGVVLADTSGIPVQCNWVEVTNVTTSAGSFYTVETSSLAGTHYPKTHADDTTVLASGICGVSKESITNTTATLDVGPSKVDTIRITHSLGSACDFIVNYGVKVTKPFHDLRNVGL